MPSPAVIGIRETDPWCVGGCVGVQSREALERMEEMRQLIGLRQGEPAVTPRGRPRSLAAPSDAASASRGSGGESNSALFEGFARTVEGLTDEAEDGLSRSMSCHESLQDELRQLASDFKEVRGWW